MELLLYEKKFASMRENHFDRAMSILIWSLSESAKLVLPFINGIQLILVLFIRNSAAKHALRRPMRASKFNYISSNRELVRLG